MKTGGRYTREKPEAELQLVEQTTLEEKGAKPPDSTSVSTKKPSKVTQAKGETSDAV